MSKSTKVTVRLFEKTVFKKSQRQVLKELLAEADLSVGSFIGFGEESASTNVVSCSEHSCVGFSNDGGTDDCSAKHSSCTTEACSPNQCSGHNCKTEACSGQKGDNGPDGCYPHSCGTHTQSIGQMMDMMMKDSPTFASFVSIQRKIGASGLSLSIDS